MLVQKKKIRREMLQRRRQVHAQKGRQETKDLAQYFVTHVASMSYKIVGGYKAIGSEIDPSLLLHDIFKRGISIGLPVVDEKTKTLFFRAYRFGDSLIKGKMNIEEPLSSMPIVIPDIVCIPLVACNIQGIRLGRGGGYYDRTLECLRKIKDIHVIGLAYDEQFVDNLPCEPHDQCLNAIITPSGVISIDRTE